MALGPTQAKFYRKIVIQTLSRAFTKDMDFAG